MCSVSNYSVSQLHTIFIARQDAWLKLHDERLTRLVQQNENSGSLTIEQQNLNKRVSLIRKASVATRNKRSKSVVFVFNDYDQALPIDQPGIRDQIEALIDYIGVEMLDFEDEVRELEGIAVTIVQ